MAKSSKRTKLKEIYFLIMLGILLFTTIYDTRLAKTNVRQIMIVVITLITLPTKYFHSHN